VKRLMRPLRDFLLRAHGSDRSRRLLPTALLFPLFDLYARLGRRLDSEQYRVTEEFQRTLLEHRGDGAGPALAERGIAEFWRFGELFWRPWLMARGEAEESVHLRSALAQGRGVVLSFTHYGNPYAQFHILRRYGVDAWVIAGPHHFDAREGYARLFTRQGRRYISLLGPGRAILPPGSFDTAAEVLGAGGVVSVAFDIAGTMPTPFLGREVSLASGSAALAHATDALIVPFTIGRRGRLPVMRFAPGLDPREHESATALQAALARVMEAWALERPELLWPYDMHPDGPPLVRGQPLGRSPS
jgi:lauroyl/myristoyl acyltransferase